MANGKDFRRVLNRDGSFNTIRLGIKKRRLDDVYHTALRLPNRRFFGGLALGFLALNALFGLGYYWAGEGAISGLVASTEFERYSRCFFFSVQTLATIGYGALSPHSNFANWLVTIEAFVGPLGFAVATGLLFTRFSRPTARVKFSSTAVITQHEGIPTLMFRLANIRTNQIVEAHIEVITLLNSVSKEGTRFRVLKDLNLKRNRTPIFAASWTVMHFIDDASPLKGLTKQALKDLSAEILVSFTGLDDTFNQPVHSRQSYVVDEIHWDHKFVDMMDQKGNGEVTIDITKIDQIEPS